MIFKMIKPDQLLHIAAHTLRDGGCTARGVAECPRFSYAQPGEILDLKVGYAVSLRGGVRFVYGPLHASDAEALGHFVEDLTSALADLLLHEPELIGTWIEQNGGHYVCYVDPVVFYNDRSEALIRAMHEGQKAFYSFAEKKSIYTGVAA